MTGVKAQVHSVKQVALLHESGKIAEAAAAYEGLLAQQPHDATLLGLFAVTQFQLGRREEGERAWHRSLATEVPVRARLQILAIMLEAVKGSEVSDLIANLAVPDWPE